MKEKFVLSKEGVVRTRFAPSPTGFLHLGGIRTALFNYLFAKKNKGRFILRIEDTDKERSKPEYERDIIESLKFLHLEWDEGPEVNGKYGPYRQSERIEIYKKYLEQLLKENKAYYCFCSKEELDGLSEYQSSQGIAPHYNGKCRNLSEEEKRKKLSENIKPVIRLKTNAQKIKFFDLIRKDVEFDAGLIGDFIIAKGLEEPLYNFAVVIDDYEMNITHIIRGEEHLSNTPKQILIQEALKFTRPQYAHIPIILASDRSKMSKRHGSIALNQYKKEGYLPEAIINFLSFLGWNPGTEKEIYSLAELINDFSLERIQKAGAIFNPERLDYLNGFYIRRQSLKKLTELSLPYLMESGFIKTISSNEFIIPETEEKITFSDLEKIVSLYQERLKKISEIVELTKFFFKNKLIYSKELLKWKQTEDQETFKMLDALCKEFNKIDDKDWKKKNLEKLLLDLAERVGDRGKVFWPLRVALTGEKVSAGPVEISETLGKKKTIERLMRAQQIIKL